MWLFACAPFVVVDELQYDATRRRNLGGGGGGSENDDDDKSRFLCKRRFLKGDVCEDGKNKTDGNDDSMGSTSLYVSL
jgi:hypothetical protein